MIRLIAMKSQGGRRCLQVTLLLPQQPPGPLPVIAITQLLPPPQQQSYHTQTLLSSAAATTGAQKRALQHNQISPSTKVPSGTGTAATTTSSSSSPPPKPPSADHTMMMMGAAVAAGAVGAGYYYYTTTTNSAATTTDSTKKETAAPIVTDAPIQDETTQVPVVTKDGPTATTTTTPNIAAADTEHRVTSIMVPSKMKNTSSATTGTTVPMDHPPQGNRVTHVLASPPSPTTSSSGSSSSSTQQQPSSEAPMMKKKKQVIEDSNVKSTHEAIQELQHHTTASAMESLISSHQSMWSHTNNNVVVGNDNTENGNTTTTAAMAQLQQRIGQLQYELQDRTKWEAIRLKEFLIMKEKEVTDQYLELMQKQRLEFEDLMAKKLREQEHILSQQLFRAIQEKEATIQSVMSAALETQKQEYEEEKKVWEEMTSLNIQSKLEDQFLQQLEEYKSRMTKALQEKVRQMQGMADKLQQLQTALDASQTSKEGSLKAHRISAAALALAEKLESHSSAKTEFETLKLAAGNEGVISTACATLPVSVVSTGVPTLSELQTHFMNSVQPKCRQAAFVPKGRVGLEGQLAGMLFATLRYAPSYEDVAPESDSDSAEYVLVRASRYVQLGELETAVDELDKLTGQPAFVVADWKKNAIDRINVEKALKVIKMECALLNESCLE